MNYGQTYFYNGNFILTIVFSTYKHLKVFCEIHTKSHITYHTLLTSNSKHQLKHITNQYDAHSKKINCKSTNKTAEVFDKDNS